MGEFTDAQRDFLFNDEKGTTDYTNMSFDVGFTNNELFTWYAGDIGLAVGAQFMTDEINDTPGIESLSCNLWGEGNVGECGYATIGETETIAAYAETAIPLLAGKPGFEYLELNASARWTEVSIDKTVDTTAEPPIINPARDFSDTTYKVGLNWKINDNFRFRANTGTSFRTPALFELYRKNFHSWPGQRNNDPCHEWGDGLEDGDISQRMAANCAAEGIPDDINSLLAMDVITGGGAAVLNAETAESKTIGMVFTADSINFRMSVDYWDLEVEDQIGIFSHIGILEGCYDSDTYPNDALCSLITREGANSGTESFKVNTVQSSYINLDVQRTAGWDIEADWATSLANSWDLTVRGAATYTTEKETESVEGEVTSRRGRAGNPEWVGNLTFRLDKGPWSAAWRMNYVDGTDNNREGVATSGTRIGLDTDGERETYYYSRTLDSRIYHNASVTFGFGDGWEVNLGITNITDEKPPRATQGAGIRIEGYGAFHSQYDWKGRRYGLNIQKTF
jgi:iron complex outermembrane receptor protein